MGCMLRSDPMAQYDIFLQPESAFRVVSQLGDLGCVQFEDLNEDLNAFQRTFVLEICRIAEIERKLRFIYDKMREDDIYIPKLKEEPNAMLLHETNYYETTIERWERLVAEMSTNQAVMNKTYGQLSEMKFVLDYIAPMLGNADIRTANFGTIKNAVQGGKKPVPERVDTSERTAMLTVITGLVQRRRSYSFQLMVWRISRGCAFYKQSRNDEIFKDNMTNTNVRKVGFLLVVQGEQLGSRIKQVCDGFRCDLYPLPPTETERNKVGIEMDGRIKDILAVISETKTQRCLAMRAMARSYATISMKLKKAKAIFNILNYFVNDITKNCLIGRCWIPIADMPKVQQILELSTITETSMQCFVSKITTFATPPTFHRTNKFTHGFQALISAYGDSAYRELNPGLYTIVTFPFLFSLMFGDMGHGAIMLAAALWMIIKEKQFIAERSDSEIWNIMFGGRYIMLLMSLFSIYAGFVYNDCFSKAFTIFPSGWSIKQSTMNEFTAQETFLLEPTDHNHAYYFGKDPAWELAKNKILFENSLKMKLSIIIGVIHMIFGITLSLFNHIYFVHDRYLIVLQFIPQILFLVCIFFWLVILIFFKWFKYGGANQSKAVAPECDAYMFGGQRRFQQALLATAVICVPVMLFGPPCCAAQMKKKKRAELLKKKPDEDDDPMAYAQWKHEMEHASESFGDLMIHQGVETIEFVLSTISHTASYLRLWALSLAHAQLSEMLWNMIFSKMALQDHSLLGAVKIVPVFIVWGTFTINILVLMEGLSAFLHTLRLHWVEFMSKFFKGGGTMFKPFSYEALFGDTGKEKAEVCPHLKEYDY